MNSQILRRCKTSFYATAIFIALGLFVRAASASESMDEQAFYVDLFGGLSLLNSPSSNFTPVGGALVDGEADLKTGWLGGLAVGYEFNSWLRVEGEISYRRNSVSGLTTPGLDAATGGDYAALMFMANAYYDIADLDAGFAVFTPYIGAGIGFAEEIDVDIDAAMPLAQFEGNGFAYQFLAGVKWRYDSNITGGLGVRYTRAGNITLDGDTGTLDVKYNPWAVILSVGYRF